MSDNYGRIEGTQLHRRISSVYPKRAITKLDIIVKGEDDDRKIGIGGLDTVCGKATVWTK